MKLLKLIVFILTCFHCIQGSHAWGKEAHEIVANIAYSLLSKEIQTAIDYILFPNSTYEISSFTTTGEGPYDPSKYASSMAAVASWADIVRYTKEFSWTGPLHFVDVRDDLIPGGCPTTAMPIRSPKEQRVSSTDSTHTYEDDNRDYGEGLDDLKKCRLDYDRDCGNGLCNVNAVTTLAKRIHSNYTSKFTHNNSDMILFEDVEVHSSELEQQSNHHSMNFTIRQSLMFLIHFVADVHQPLHVSRKSDVGGNTFHVTIPKKDENADHEEEAFYSYFHTMGSHEDRDSPYMTQKGWTLHSIWDTALIEYKMKAEFSNSLSLLQAYIEDMYLTKENMKLWLECSNGMNKTCVSGWAEETWDDALRWAYGDENGNEIHDGQEITKRYIDSRISIIEERLAAAAVRLAAVLKTIFTHDNLVLSHF